MANTQSAAAGRPFGMLDKLSYAAGDFGCNMSFSLAGTYFTLFYTQYMGIDSLAFAGILIVLKIWDAINDPLIGGMIDSTRREFRRGKFKTFISWGSLGLMVAAALCFLPFTVAQNMRYLVAAMYCVSAVLMWVSVGVIYNLDKKTLAQMEKDLGRTS